MRCDVTVCPPPPGLSSQRGAEPSGVGDSEIDAMFTDWDPDSAGRGGVVPSGDRWLGGRPTEDLWGRMDGRYCKGTAVCLQSMFSTFIVHSMFTDPVSEVEFAICLIFAERAQQKQNYRNSKSGTSRYTTYRPSAYEYEDPFLT